jgi:hypothetical protein
MAAFVDGKAAIVRAVKLTLPNPIPYLPSCHTPMSKLSSHPTKDQPKEKLPLLKREIS